VLVLAPGAVAVRVVVAAVVAGDVRAPLLLPGLQQLLSLQLAALLSHLLEGIALLLRLRRVVLLTGFELDLLGAALVELLVPLAQLPRALLLLHLSALLGGELGHLLR
jgi:hypothetical protein